MEDIKFLTILTTALIDSLNPCAIGVLLILISAILSLYENRKKLIIVGFIYILSVYISYFLAGIGLLYFIYKLKLSEIIGLVAGILVIVGGFIEIKDFFWYGKGFSLKIPESQKEKIKKRTEKITISGAVILGFMVSAVELPCTGGPYLAITTLLAKNINIKALYYLLFYNFIFVLPLIAIVLLSYIGISSAKISQWKDKNRAYMRLFTGILMIGLGIIMILYSRGYIVV